MFAHQVHLGKQKEESESCGFSPNPIATNTDILQGNGKWEMEMAGRWMDPKNQRENGGEKKENVNGKMLNWAKQDITRKEKKGGKEIWGTRGTTRDQMKLIAMKL